jgi:hypothetical protein
MVHGTIHIPDTHEIENKKQKLPATDQPNLSIAEPTGPTALTLMFNSQIQVSRDKTFSALRFFTANVYNSTPKTPDRRTYVCGYHWLGDPWTPLSQPYSISRRGPGLHSVFHLHQTNVPVHVIANMQHLVHVYTRLIIMLPRWNASPCEVHSCIRIHTNT